jgi:hypothetical protein
MLADDGKNPVIRARTTTKCFVISISISLAVQQGRKLLPQLTHV